VQPDFFAVEIINSNVVFKFDLGGGPAEIVVNRNVSDGEWHEVIAER
jgi:laminin alpha 3/5